MREYLIMISRLLIAQYYLIQGIHKILAPEIFAAWIQSAGIPFVDVVYTMSIIIELVCGILIVVGYHTRLVCCILALYVLFIAVFFYSDFTDILESLLFQEKLVSIGALLAIVAFGAERYSLDTYFKNKKKAK